MINCHTYISTPTKLEKREKTADIQPALAAVGTLLPQLTFFFARRWASRCATKGSLWWTIASDGWADRCLFGQCWQYWWWSWSWLTNCSGRN